MKEEKIEQALEYMKLQKGLKSLEMKDLRNSWEVENKKTKQYTISQIIEFYEIAIELLERHISNSDIREKTTELLERKLEAERIIKRYE